jgi:hypothetical protein
MKGIIKLALAASVAVGVSASQHGHAHHHMKKHVQEVAKRDAVTVTVAAPGPTVTVYEIDGEQIPNEEAAEGLRNGEYVIVGETDPTPVSDQKSEASTASEGGQFFEQKVEKSTTAAPPTKTSASPTPSPSATKSATKPATKGSIDTPFDSGNVPCSEFPSEWGPIAVPWMNTGGWSGIQKAPNYRIGDVSISLIVTGVSGDFCEPGDFCSYACPPGYQKTQWPESQGADNESIGGLFCNSDGMLELTREDHPTLCEKGVGGVSIKNELDVQVSTCRTDYPGTECMVIPLLSTPGSTVELTNPDSLTYYVWADTYTTAQYYVNPSGMGVEESCVWVSPSCPDCAGNYSPMNLGVGQDEFGITYLSIFLNSPSSKALLDFNIEITGDVTSKCYYKDGAFSGDNPNGCTTSLNKGGQAVYRYFR